MLQTPTTTVHLLGITRMVLGSDNYPFEPDKRYQCLAYLAYRGDWVAREQLAYLFWPDNAPDAARDNLRHLLSRVRSLDCAVGLEVERSRVRWMVSTDVAGFVRAIQAKHWSEALSLYGGSFLEGLGGEGEFSSWLEGERGQMHQAWRTALLARAGELEHAGKDLEAAGLLQNLLAHEELDEEGLQIYVNALLRGGEPNRALRAYEEFVRRLKEELGLGPTAVLERLGQSLRDQTEVLAKPVALATPSPPTLPTLATSFVGRDLELAEIAQRLTQPDCHLLTLTGSGGIGKTRLGSEALKRLAPLYPDGVFFVPLEALTSSAQIVPKIAEVLGLYLGAQADPLPNLVQFLGSKKLLLLLDNFEHLLEGATLALELVQRCPNLRLLVTSRERLDLEAEWVLRIGGLDHPDGASVGLEESRLFDAVQLFSERARRVRADFEVGAGDLADLLEVCRLVDGSPLGLELAAVWVRMIPLAEIVREIRQNLDFLNATQRDRAVRHHSLRAVFEHSWKLLTPTEQSVLRKLSVFVDGFRLEAARQVVGASLPVLAALVDKSLLRLSASGRYDRHVLLYQYTREKLAAHQGEEAVVCEQHGRYFLQRVVEWADDTSGRLTVAALHQELQNIRAAWQWAVENVRLEELRQAVNPVARFFDHGMQVQEAVAGFTAAAATLNPDDPTHHAVLGNLLIRQGWFAMRLGRYAEAQDLTQQGMAYVPAKSTIALIGLNALGSIAERVGQYAEAVKHFKKAIGLGAQQSLVFRGGWLCNLAQAESALGEHPQAIEHARQAQVFHERLGSASANIRTLSTLGSVLAAAGQIEEGQALLIQGLELAQEHDDHVQKVFILEYLAELANARGSYQEAQHLGGQALAAARASGSRSIEINALAILGRVSANLGLPEQAGVNFRQSLELAWKFREMPRLFEALVYLAEWRIAQGRAPQAAPLLHLVLGYPQSTHAHKTLAQQLLDQLGPKAALKPSQAKALGQAKYLQAQVNEAINSLG